MLKRKKQITGELDMANAQIDKPASRKPLRLWPGVVAAALLLLVRYVVPIVVPESLFIGVMGGMAGGLVIVVWWVFFSRAPWLERLGAVGLMIVAVFATPYILHESIATGAMGMLFFILVIPVLSLAFVAWAVVSRRLSDGLRRAACGRSSGPVALPPTSITISRGAGLRLPRSGSWPKPVTGRRCSRWLRQQQ